MKFLPGTFYHGSITIDIERFRVGHEECGIRSPAVFFTHLPDIAVEIGVSRWGCGGRLYRVKIEDRNPYIIPPAIWESRYGPDGEEWNGKPEFFQREAEIIKQVRSWGYDSIVYCTEAGVIVEIAVLDGSIIRPIRPAPKRIAGRPKGRPVLYCEKAVWPLLDQARLAEPNSVARPKPDHYTRFGRLIDPYTGKGRDLPWIPI